ncbi:WAT1-related protein At1g21890-like [Apium graveolens]|uniref:WAT1-related protein At1g21890-like n=1 Tax=Apium graveolens TaxID=4045 RepID=UPI003D7A1001
MGTTTSLSQLLTNIRPYLAMICLQFGYAGMYIVTMVSFKQGMSHWVLVVYRHVVATLAIAPFAFVLERKIRPKLTLSVFLKVMLLGLLEPVIDQNLYYVGMKSTSATFAAATVNVLPALTFIMAIIFRMERVKLRQKHGLAKVIGTSITLSGAMLMTLYKGPVVNILGGYSQETQNENSGSDASSGQHWVGGTIMLLSCTVGWSAFFIVQSMALKEYPAPLSLTSLICVMGMMEGGVVALVMERDMSAWAIGFDSRLLAAAYSGVVCSGIAYYVQGFVNKVRGPVFVTAFSPLAMIITAILGAIILSEQVRLGSLLGAVVVVIGLYSVVWGKSKDEKITNGEGKSQELPVVLQIKNKSARVIFDEAPATNSSTAVKNPLSGEP